MAKLNSIKKNTEFKRIYSRGKTYVTPVVVVYVLKNRRYTLRFGITTSKKIGNAVKRNRSRRIIREAVIQLLPQIKSGYDLVFVARGKTPYVKSTDIEKTLGIQLKKAGLLK